MRTCKYCGRSLPDDAFYRNKVRCKDCVKEYQKEYHLRTYDPEKRHREYEENKDWFKAYYQSTREERLRTSTMVKRNRRAKLAGAEGTITKEEWESVLNKFGKKCAYCGADGSPLGLSMDHIVPLKKGGSNTKDNILPVCRNCNSSKHTTPYWVWYPQQRFYDPEKEMAIVMHRMESV